MADLLASMYEQRLALSCLKIPTFHTPMFFVFSARIILVSSISGIIAISLIPLLIGPLLLTLFEYRFIADAQDFLIIFWS